MAFQRSLRAQVRGSDPVVTLALAINTLKSGELQMSPTTIRIIAGVIFVVLVVIIIARRKSMASKRKALP